jgi:hypothetical protein
MNEAEGDNAVAILLHEIYIAELRVHAIMLIWLGYRRLGPTAFATAEEDDITGELVRAVRDVLQDPSSPEWVDHYEVKEQVPQNVDEKHGKRRPKMDIEVERHQRGVRPCLGFEAKRLGRGEAIAGYLGSEGLGAFLTGYYPTTHGESGMLGYVQERTNDEWSAKLARELSLNETQHRVVQGRELRRFDVEPTMPAFSSEHTDTEGRPLQVIHVLLSCKRCRPRFVTGRVGSGTTL